MARSSCGGSTPLHCARSSGAGGRSPARGRGAPAVGTPAADCRAPTLKGELLHGTAEVRLNRGAQASVRRFAEYGPC
eukprot:12351714-Alexandrium_andersonii.AAC.1